MTDTISGTRVERLNVASVKRFRDIDELMADDLGPGRLMADELLSVAGLNLDLTDEQRVTLSRQEVAAVLDAGVRFEAVLMAGFAMQIVAHPDLADPRATYLLHEIGEETRHSRLFIDLLVKIGDRAKNPLAKWPLSAIDRISIPHVLKRPALLYTLVLGGEEIPDLIQKRVSEHPESDPHLAAVNRYHRSEEARHLSFARTLLPEVWATASWSDRFAVRHIAPMVIGGMWDTLVHPGVYAAAGLPGWKTWNAVRHDPARIAVRHEATRPVLTSLLEAGVMAEGRIPRGWHQLCGV